MEYRHFPVTQQGFRSSVAELPQVDGEADNFRKKWVRNGVRGLRNRIKSIKEMKSIREGARLALSQALGDQDWTLDQRTRIQRFRFRAYEIVREAMRLQLLDQIQYLVKDEYFHEFAVGAGTP